MGNRDMLNLTCSTNICVFEKNAENKQIALEKLKVKLVVYARRLQFKFRFQFCFFNYSKMINMY